MSTRGMPDTGPSALARWRSDRKVMGTFPASLDSKTPGLLRQPTAAGRRLEAVWRIACEADERLAGNQRHRQ
jgi:hypothetical protein